MNDNKPRETGGEYPVSFNGAEIKYAHQGPINYIVMPSLERTALFAVVVKLWREVDRRAFRRWRRTMDFTDRENFEETILEIKEKVSLLSLPTTIEMKIINLIKPIGEHIWEWRMDCYFKDYDINSIQSIDILMWTYRGTIDRARTTASQIAKNRIVHKLYAKACHYCIEHEIFRLWDELLEYEKDLYCNKIIEDTCHSCFEVYWTCVVTNELSKIPAMVKDSDDRRVNYKESIPAIMMMSSVILGNSTAATYFWYKLTEKEKAKNITKYMEVAFEYNRVRMYANKDSKEFTDIICFLLSHMDVEQQKYVFKNYSKPLLEMLITSWPWQEFFVPTISMMWDFLDINIYAYMVSVIVRCIHGEMKNDVRVVEESHLWQLWRATPKAVKKDFFQCVAGNVSHLNGIFKGKKFESAWILLSEVLLRQNVEPDTFRDCQFIYKSLNRRNTESHAFKF